jgi:hypothetical protein
MTKEQLIEQIVSMEIILQEAAFERTRVLKTAAWRT